MFDPMAHQTVLRKANRIPSDRWTDAAWAISNKDLRNLPREAMPRVIGLRLARFGIKETDIASVLGVSFQAWCAFRAQLAAAERNGKIDLSKAVKPSRGGRPRRNLDCEIAARIRSGATDSEILCEMGDQLKLAYIQRVRRLTTMTNLTDFGMSKSTIKQGDRPPAVDSHTTT